MGAPIVFPESSPRPTTILGHREKRSNHGAHHGSGVRTPQAVALRVLLRYSIALADFASSRSANFWILPVEVFGRSPNTIAFGTLNPAMYWRQN